MSPHFASVRLWPGAVTAALALCLAGTGQASAADVNNARNSGFESGLSNWTCSAGSGTTVSSPVHGGSAALKATPAGQDNARCAQTVAVQPGTTYTLSAWVQGGYAYLGVTGTGSTDVSTWTPDSTSWKQLSTTFTTGSSTSRSRCTRTAGTGRRPTTPTPCRCTARTGAAAATRPRRSRRRRAASRSPAPRPPPSPWPGTPCRARPGTTSAGTARR